jgi:UDP-glucose 4-epimerase
MKKICIVGGSGFLGSHVADALTLAGFEVSIFDNAYSKWINCDQKMIIGDLMDFQSLSNAIRDSEFVFNFAALSDINLAINKPADTIKINILGNLNVLEACRIHNVKRFIYASTVYVYSREGGFYRCSKQAAESYIEEYYRMYGQQYTILRFGSLYGPRTDSTNGLYKIVKRAIDTGVLTYEGNPDSQREYIHVDDAARASVHCLEEKFINQSVVLTGQEPMRIIDLLQTIKEIMDLKTDIKFINDEKPGHYIRTAYAFKSNIGLKYRPSMHVDLGQGLLALIEDITNNCNKDFLVNKINSG